MVRHNNSGERPWHSPAGKHALDGESGPLADAVAKFFEEFIPSLIEGEKQFCGARDIHSAEYKTRQGKDKRLWLQSSRAHAAGVLLFFS